jgi:hypothetical protein
MFFSNFPRASGTLVPLAAVIRQMYRPIASVLRAVVLLGMFVVGLVITLVSPTPSPRD